MPQTVPQKILTLFNDINSISAPASKPSCISYLITLAMTSSNSFTYLNFTAAMICSTSRKIREMKWFDEMMKRSKR